MASVKRNTVLKNVPYRLMNVVIQALDYNHEWKNLAMQFKKPNGKDLFEQKDIKGLQIAFQRGGSATDEMLQSLSRRNLNVGHLLEALKRAGFYDLVKEITEDFLGEEYIPDEEEDILLAEPEPKPRAAARMPADDHFDNQNLNSFEPKVNNKVLNITGAVFDESSTDVTRVMNIPPTGHVPLGDSPESPESPVKTRNIGDSSSSSRGPPLPPRQTETIYENEHSGGLSPALPRRCLSQELKEKPLPPTPVEDEDPSNIIEVETAILEELKPGKAVEVSFELLKLVTDNYNPVPLDKGGRLIGKGGFAEVFLGRVGKKEIAVKVLKSDNECALNNEVQFNQEVDIMSRIVHKNLLPLLAYSTKATGAYFTLVYPYMCGGSLLERLKCEEGQKPLTVSERVNIAQGTAHAINHLHTGTDSNRANIHRDVKSSNVLLDEHEQAKLGDFGLIRPGPLGNDDSATETKKVIGSQGYMAPEVTDMEISAKIDVYSFGVVLLELLTGLPPYNTKESCSLVKEVRTNGGVQGLLDERAGTWPPTLVESMYSVAAKCLEMLTENRPSMEQVLPAINTWTV